MEDIHIPVAIEKLGKSSSATVSQIRSHLGTCYFPAGTNANFVCMHVNSKMATMFKKSAGGMGIWLLQVRVPPEEIHLYPAKDVEEGGYVTLRDGKYELRDGHKYVCLKYTGGPDITVY